jgi:ribonucleotide reductase alpha subunit
MAESITFEGFITKFRKRIRDSYQQVGDTMVAGGVKDMEQYKYLLGQAHAYQLIDQEISNLLNPKEEKNGQEQDNTNVVRFGKDGRNTKD